VLSTARLLRSFAVRQAKNLCLALELHRGRNNLYLCHVSEVTEDFGKYRLKIKATVAPF